jgi:hypothetical protein
MEDDVIKPQKTAGANVREQKAAALDAQVKQDLASQRSLQSSKMTRLKALRLAKSADEPVDETAKPKRVAAKRRIWA